ncbi:MAG: GNAT family N-acetyltransferase [Xanthomonadales bacterium]|nr:GNAT family N-acetyltransferase [Xanthomonadales bacterium]
MIPSLHAEGLLLRPLQAEDAESLVPLMRDPRVAEPYVLPRYPWSLADAHTQIAAMEADFEAQRRLDLGIVPAPLDQVVGVVSLGFALAHDRAELGFWIGQPYWGRGYTGQAVDLVLAWAFTERGLHRVTARTLGDNQRAAKLLRSRGFRAEGLLRQHQYHWGRFRDVALWGRLVSDIHPPTDESTRNASDLAGAAPRV